jgi:hypothetical protein
MPITRGADGLGSSRSSSDHCPAPVATGRGFFLIRETARPATTKGILQARIVDGRQKGGTLPRHQVGSFAIAILFGGTEMDILPGADMRIAMRAGPRRSRPPQAPRSG